MLNRFIADLQAGLQWLKEEIARPMPGLEPKTSRKPSGTTQKLEPRRARRPAPAAPDTHNHDEDHHHHQAYDGDVFSSDSGGGDGGGD